MTRLLIALMLAAAAAPAAAQSQEPAKPEERKPPPRLNLKLDDAARYSSGRDAAAKDAPAPRPEESLPGLGGSRTLPAGSTAPYPKDVAKGR